MDIRDENFNKNSNQNGSVKPKFNDKSLPGHGFFTSKISLKLDEDVEKELLEMQEKGIDINEFLREALQKRKEKIEEKKEKSRIKSISNICKKQR